MVGVLPLDRLGMGGIGVDVAAKFAGQVRDGAEDATSDDITLDLGEPEFDLVEPGRVGGGEVEMNPRILLEKLANGWSFVGREVVENDVDLLARPTQANHFLQEIDELPAGVAGGGFAVHSSAGGIQGGVQREGAVSVVLESMPLGASRRERQYGVKSIERLNGGLLVDAEDGRVLWRVEIQADDVGGLTFEVGIVAGDIALVGEA